MMQGKARFFSWNAVGNRKAFTLLELLVVMAVIGILAGLLFPLLNRAKESGRSTACLGQLRQIGIGLQLYVQDNRNRLPVMYDRGTNTIASGTAPAAPSANPEQVLAPYIGSQAVWRCPSDRQGIFEQTGSSYAWNSLLNGQDADRFRVLTIPFKPHQMPVFFDKEAFHRARGARQGVNFLYADGHIKNLLAIEGLP